MDKRHDDWTDHDGRARPAKRGTTPIRLRPPEAIPISDEDYRQAVTALATMIASWWRDQQEHRSE